MRLWRAADDARLALDKRALRQVLLRVLNHTAADCGPQPVVLFLDVLAASPQRLECRDVGHWPFKGPIEGLAFAWDDVGEAENYDDLEHRLSSPLGFAV